MASVSEDSTRTPAASVVIPLYNGLEFTTALWQSVLNLTDWQTYEYIFVDNCSTDGTREWLQGLGASAKFILNQQNRNFAVACNQGAQAAASEFVIFLNNDTEVTPGWAAQLIAPFLSDNTLGAVGNKQIFPETSLIHHAGIYIDLTGHPKHYLEGIDQDDHRVNFVRECSAVTGACMAVRKDDFFLIGGFNEDYKNGYEDIELCLALRKRGKKIIYTPKSVIFHHVSKSAGRFNHNLENYKLFKLRCKEKLVPDLPQFLRQNAAASGAAT